MAQVYLLKRKPDTQWTVDQVLVQCSIHHWLIPCVYMYVHVPVSANTIWCQIRGWVKNLRIYFFKHFKKIFADQENQFVHMSAWSERHWWFNYLGPLFNVEFEFACLSG